MDKKSIEYNNKIKSDKLKIIDEEGKFLGDMSKEEALKIAEERELDLVVCSPSANPPVAKLCMLDKYLFTLKKKEQQIKKNTKVMELKKIKIGVNIDINDINVKVKQAQKFINEGSMVNFFMRFRRKEMLNTEKGISSLKKIASQIVDMQISKDVSLEKNVASLTIKPESKKAKSSEKKINNTKTDETNEKSK